MASEAWHASGVFSMHEVGGRIVTGSKDGCVAVAQVLCTSCLHACVCVCVCVSVCMRVCVHVCICVCVCVHNVHLSDFKLHTHTATQISWQKAS